MGDAIDAFNAISRLANTARGRKISIFPFNAVTIHMPAADMMRHDDIAKATHRHYYAI